MPEVRVIESLAAIEPAEWAALFPGELEDYHYLLAVERAGLPGFGFRYLVVHEDGRLLAAAPAFVTRYPLDTTLTGSARRMAGALRRAFPDALTLRLACIGSPCTERALVGFAPEVSALGRGQLTGLIFDAFEELARRERCGLLGVKDAAADDRAPWATAAILRGYAPLASLPIARLEIDFPDIDAYFARLSHATRRDMRRKLRRRGEVRVEVRADVSDLIEEVMALYRQTLARADMSFEELTADFFLGVPREMAGRAFYVLYFVDDRLLGANLLIQDEGVLLDKFFVMDEAAGRPLNLYFLSWFTNVELCLERGLARYQAGQAAYRDKLRLGCRLVRTTNHFRHRNLLLNAALGLAAPLFAADPTLEDAA